MPGMKQQAKEKLTLFLLRHSRFLMKNGTGNRRDFLRERMPRRIITAADGGSMTPPGASGRKGTWRRTKTCGARISVRWGTGYSTESGSIMRCIRDMRRITITHTGCRGRCCAFFLKQFSGGK